MILTLTPNPSLDRTFEVDDLAVGEVVRATATRKDPGGKGVNVARALGANAVPATAVLPVGGADGAQLVDLLATSGITVAPVRVGGETRSNVTVVDAAGRTTKLNAPGTALTEAEATALLDAVAAALGAQPDDRVVVGAGSLPAGAGDDFYVRLGQVCARAGARLALDTSGAPLAAAVAAGVASLVKPNDEELAELAGRELRTVGDVVAAARDVMRAGVAQALVSLGSHGALLVTPERTWWAGGPPLVPLSTVGAGDSTLAGYLSAAHLGPRQALRTAVAWGRAAVLLPGSGVPAPAQIHPDDVQVVAEPDPTTAVEEL
ncbi:1-phosphofructokinase [Xylanimonas ulmi]|uniref:1-phosphofructokinase n=1 Tax=Xylanimonas ulmi TaxID=228973 RepID=A0A4Q7M0D6_9MICO|nr:1-phosphofructokinase [Xylanibacterium ulmi]RZS60804.1 1-phosphofructokinase [Xylanibacterium ulmi]